MTGIRILKKTNVATICSIISTTGDDELEKFIDSLTESEQKKLMVLFGHFCETGLIRNDQKFKPMGDKLFEFKSDNIRVLCFYLPDSINKTIVLSNGFIKKKRKTPPNEIKKAKGNRNTIESLHSNGNLKIYKD